MPDPDEDEGPRPCVPISCPPLQEYQIDRVIPPRDYVPGSFAREVAAFYGLPDPFPDDD